MVSSYTDKNLKSEVLMLSFLPGIVKGISSIVLFSINTVFWVFLLLIVSAFRIIIPLKFWYRLTSKISIFIANNWITVNNIVIALFQKIDWDVKFSEEVKMNDWYLVLSNHQTWIDIVVYRRLPM